MKELICDKIFETHFFSDKDIEYMKKEWIELINRELQAEYKKIKNFKVMEKTTLVQEVFCQNLVRIKVVINYVETVVK